MGKYVMLAVIAVVLGSTILTRQGMETDIDTSEDQTDRQEKVLARRIANSAFEMALSELRRDFKHWRTEREDIAHEGGTYDLTASGPSTGPVSLTAVGRYGGAAYEITGRSKQDTTVSALFNAITALTPIDFKVAGGGCSGAPCVSGIDPGGGEDRHGISLPPGEDTDEVCEEFDDKVEGRESGCDVWSRTGPEDEWVVRKFDVIESRINDLVESGAEDVTVCDGCKVSDLEADSGILYVTDDLRYNGEEQWNGLVFVADGGSVRINGGGDTRNINGGLLLSDSTAFRNDEDFDMNGGNAVQYNSEELRKLFAVLPALRGYTVKITDRTGRFLHTSE